MEEVGKYLADILKWWFVHCNHRRSGSDTMQFSWWYSNVDYLPRKQHV